MLLECKYNGFDCSSSFIRSLSSVFGNCFTFNWKAAMDKLFTVADMASTPAMFEGLSMIFYLPRHLNFPSTLFEDGLIVLLHDNDELPLTVINGLRLRPGMAHTITYRKSQTIFLPEPYTNCISTVPPNLDYLYEAIFESKFASQAAYSEVMCHEFCEQAFVFSKCGCILPIPFLIGYVFSLDHSHLLSANICIPSTSQERCALIARQEFLLSSVLTATWCSRCTSQCTYTYFVYDTSALSAPTVEQKAMWTHVLLNGNSNVALPNDFAANYDAYMDINYLRVTVTCGSRYVVINKQQAKLTLVDTFSAIGGQTGL
ncbi:unnamed protein product [Rotaria sp. Silwood1]|nr:unnamed protein product [Rotaria sp. Silwood1]